MKNPSSISFAFLKWVLLATFFLLKGSQFASATIDTYLNRGFVSYPPVVDAFNFVNEGQFNAPSGVYSTYNTLNFSNRNQMFAGIGFRLDTTPSGNGVRKMANSFYNAGLVSPTAATVSGGQRLEIWSTNIVNRGLLGVDTSGLMLLKGENLDLSRGTLKVGNFSSGFFSQYWGTGTQTNGSAGVFSSTNFALSPPHLVTELFDSFYFNISNNIVIADAPTYTNAAFSSGFGTNFQVTVVYLANRNTNVTANIRFDFGVPVIQWLGYSTNGVTGSSNTSGLYLRDNLASFTNAPSLIESFWSPLAPLRAYSPSNYVMSRVFFGDYEDLEESIPDFDPSVGVDLDLNGDGSEFLTVPLDLPEGAAGIYSAWDVQLGDTSALPLGNVVGGSVTNLPGRLEISANGNLNLYKARIDGLNYVSLKATNHFSGGFGANITVPYADLDLGSTNGTLGITNLLQSLPRFTGDVEMWSGRFPVVFTNALLDAEGNTNDLNVLYHLFIVDSFVSPESQPSVRGLKLRAGTSSAQDGLVSISDPMAPYESCLIDADQLVIGQSVTNVGGIWFTNIGSLSLPFLDSFWSNNVPRLRILTNGGTISIGNAAYFGRSELDPYIVLHNEGTISAQSSTIWANIFENSGTIFSFSGPINIKADTATLQATNGGTPLLSANNGDITISANTLKFSNAIFDAGRKLSLSVTNTIDDGGGSVSDNVCTVFDGMELLVKPAFSNNLLATTITNYAFPYAEIINTWAGDDKGADAGGFTNNAALGKLVLDAEEGALYVFKGANPDQSQALYVETIEFLNFAKTDFGDVLQIEPNFQLYFANSIGVPVDKLDGKFGGRMHWVNYAGRGSSMPVALRTGGQIVVNQALAGSSVLDSDGDGLVNSLDSFPFDAPGLVTSTTDSSSSQNLSITWNAAANTRYTIECTTNLISWQVFTNLTTGGNAGPVSVQAPVSNGPRFYRVSYAP